MCFSYFQADASRSLTKHRKIASSFRDTQLFEIYQLACSLLQTAEGNIKNLNFSDDNQVFQNYKITLFTVNSEIFVRVLFSQNFAYAKFRENDILAKWGNHSLVY